MNITTRRIDRTYIELTIQVDDILHDGGFNTKEEAQAFADSLRSDLDDLDYEIGLMPDDTKKPTN